MTRPWLCCSPSRSLIINLALVATLLIGAASVMWQQPILADEWDFYRAATDWAGSRSLIPHPHTYVHAMQLSFRAFGESVGSARLVGVASALVTLALIPLLVYTLYGRSGRSDRIALVALWLYACIPLTVQNMVLLDIDNTLLVPCLLVLLILWLKAHDWPVQRRVIALGAGFAVALWVKLPTPPLLMGCLFLVHLLRGEIGRAGEILASTVAGGVAFWLSFLLYDRLAGFSVDIFGYTFGKAGALRNVLEMLVRFPQGIGVFALWLSLPLTVLLVLGIVKAAKRAFRRQGAGDDVLWLWATVLSLFYAWLIAPAWGYPRYQAPALPVLAVAIAGLVAPTFRVLPRRALALLIGAGLLTFAYKILIVGDPFWSLYAVTFETGTADLVQRLAQGIGGVGKLLVPVLATLMAVLLVARRWRVPLLPLWGAALGALAFADMVSTAAVQATADYSTRYRYTYRYEDLRQTIADLRETGGYIVAIKDVLYYTELPGEEVYGYVCPGCGPQPFLELAESGRVDAFAWTTKEDSRSPQVTRDPAVVRALTACYERATHGVFIVYTRKADGRCT